MGRTKARKDSDGRALPPNVSQMTDGRYVYRKMKNGVTIQFYSRDLSEMKDKIDTLNLDISIGMNIKLSKICLNDWWDTYLETCKKGNCKLQSYNNKVDYYNWYVRDYSIGSMCIGDITGLHARAHFKMLAEKGCRRKKNQGLARGTLITIANMLELSLNQAVADRAILCNPFTDVMLNIKAKEKQDVEAIPIEQQNRLVQFMKESKYLNWYYYFGFLLTSGMREGEALGLCWKDIDFEKNTIEVYKTMHYRKRNTSKKEFYITDPKTHSSTRTKSMTEQMKKLLLLQREYQRNLRVRQDIEIPEIDDFGNETCSHKGLVFTTRLGKPFTPEGVKDGLERVVKHYNAAEVELAKKENRPPVIIDKTRVHALRHTYCTRVAEVFSGYENPNYTHMALLMGHKNERTSKQFYAQVTEKIRNDAICKIEGLIEGI